MGEEESVSREGSGERGQGEVERGEWREEWKKETRSDIIGV